MDIGSEKRAYDITSASKNDLKKYLDKKIPIILWTTLVDSEGTPLYSEKRWIIQETGEEYIPLKNSHCVVLAGQRGSFLSKDFFVVDPISGAEVSGSFFNSYDALGRRAVVIY